MTSSDDPAPAPQTEVEADVPLLLAPLDGLPAVVTEAAALERTVAAFAAGTGPVAVDAERASGYRYTPRAYLVQLRRAGAGTALVDPVPLPDLRELGTALDGTEWVLHAASQDLPSLRDVGLVPPRLFDTELAARLLGLPRVGLGPLVEAELGVRLEKGHSAADWSRRPLPEDWLRYAALDVELLLDLRDRLEEQLVAAGKLAWAREEFDAVLAAAERSAVAPVVRSDPWRRTSGLHQVRERRRLAVVRELWQERDQLAQARDIAPGRVLADAVIVDAARTLPRSSAQVLALASLRSRSARRDAPRWAAAVRRALELPDEDLPRPQPRDPDAMPSSPRQWAERDPAAAARLVAARAVVAEVGERVAVPAENLVPPDAVRRVCWSPPSPVDPDAVAGALVTAGARAWQVGLLAEPLAAALEATGR